MASSGTRVEGAAHEMQVHRRADAVWRAQPSSIAVETASSSSANQALRQYARTPLGMAVSKADWKAVHGVGSVIATSGGQASTSPGPPPGPPRGRGPPRRSPANIRGRSPSSQSAGGTMNVTIGVSSSGRVGRPCPPRAQGLAPARTLVDQRARERLGTVRVGPERERRHHAEVAPAAPQRPEEIGVRCRISANLAAVGQDHVGADEVVDGEAVAARQPADATAQGEARDPGARDHADGHREAVRRGRRVHVVERGARLHADQAGGADPPRPGCGPPCRARCRRPRCRCRPRCGRRRGSRAAAPSSAPVRATATTSPSSAARTITAGCLSIIPFQTRRASS